MLNLDEYQVVCDTYGRLNYSNFVYHYLHFRKCRIAELEKMEEEGKKIRGFMEYPNIMALQDLSSRINEDHQMLDELVIYNGPTDKANRIINIIESKHHQFAHNFYWNSTTGEKYYQMDIIKDGRIEFAHKKDVLAYLCQDISDYIEENVCAIELGDNPDAAILTFKIWLRQVVSDGCNEPFKKRWEQFRKYNLLLPCKRTVMKAGKFIKMIDPKLTDAQVSILASDICDLARLYDASSGDVKVGSGSDFATVYTLAATFTSCMQGKPSNYFELYKKLDQCRIAYIESEDGYLLGRALLWDEVYTERGSLVKVMDRVYANNPETEATLKRWAVENGYLYRDVKGQFSNGERSLELNLYVDLSEQDIKPEEMVSLPYMDTFKMYNFDGKLRSWGVNGHSLTTQDGRVCGVNVKEK